MAIIGIRRLRYAVSDTSVARRFFTDFGLAPAGNERPGLFTLANGAEVEILGTGDAALAPSDIVGDGVHEVAWGVSDEASLDALAANLGQDHALEQVADGFRVQLFGIPFSFLRWTPQSFANAPDAVNAPGCVRRLNTHRKWRRRARPKVINHVVFRIPDFEEASRFMRARLGFRLSDVQTGFGQYLRASGSNNHHNLLFLNANANFPGCDGQLRFDHANFGVEDIDELMIGANYMVRRGWQPSDIGLGRHRIDSALFYYLPSPAGGEAEYGADADYVDDNWVPREFDVPLFGYSHFTHSVPAFLETEPAWSFKYLTEAQVAEGVAEGMDNV
ncbi:VOC family protein [Novosphingobium sp. SG707]|uniref:VOC family protein n=1 Tax=Novosphingobium sp. SG707 TaxID=2586996 RepID=UPI001444D820|nr:VOC family protein [Novosphingobium sp. SG707]NKJ00935.1 catechol 2,3-dioxygenase-like lactoylglutathione lyase family enzyme [Novosphingobium sp. SG707]